MKPLELVGCSRRDWSSTPRGSPQSQGWHCCLLGKPRCLTATMPLTTSMYYFYVLHIVIYVLHCYILLLHTVTYLLYTATSYRKSMNRSRGSSSISGFKKVKGHVNMMFSPGVCAAPGISQNDLYLPVPALLFGVLPCPNPGRWGDVARCGEVGARWKSPEVPCCTVEYRRIYWFNEGVPLEPVIFRDRWGHTSMIENMCKCCK